MKAIILSLAFLFAGPAKAETIAQLKADFPIQQTVSVPIRIVDRRDPHGNPIKTHRDVIQVQVPSADIWSWYRGSFAVATIESAPKTLQQVNARIPQDIQRLQKDVSGQSARAQADLTIQWLQTTMRAYIQRWQTVTP